MASETCEKMGIFPMITQEKCTQSYDADINSDSKKNSPSRHKVKTQVDRNKGSLSPQATIVLCLFLIAVIVIGGLIRDEVVDRPCKQEIELADLALACHQRPPDTVVKNSDGTECICQLDGTCSSNSCGNNGSTTPTCCYSASQQCVVYSSEGERKPGCCVAKLGNSSEFYCDSNSKSCTRRCSAGSVPGSGCNNGKKKYCCEFEHDDAKQGYCSLTGPSCSPCLYNGQPVQDFSPCTNADGINSADGCCYNGVCLLKSCPKVCTIRRQPAHEGQVCDPIEGPRGSGCCNNGTCISIDPSGTCPSPCRTLYGSTVAEGSSCGTIFGTDNGICTKGFCNEVISTKENNLTSTSEPTIQFFLK